jgi:UDP-N-acetylmuramate dehydrogenase
VLGGGSNLVVADAGWPGLVLKVAIPGIEQRPGREHEGKVLFDVGAGESWDRFVSHAVMAKCAGVECLSGIPGQRRRHAGAECRRLRTGSFGDHRIGRSLRPQRRPGARVVPRGLRLRLPLQHFQYDERGRFIILRVTYALTPGGEPRTSNMPTCKRHFEGRETRPDLAETREAVRHIRARKGCSSSPATRLPERGIVFQESRAHRRTTA